MAWPQKVEKFDRFLERGVIVALIITMIAIVGLGLLEIVLRWFQSSFLWVGPFNRHLVLLAAFLGGVVACGHGTHISIDILGRYLKNKNSRWRQGVDITVSLASLVVLGFLGLGAVNLCLVEWESGRVLLLGIHSAFFLMVIPLGFLLIFLRFLCQLLGRWGTKGAP
jgi:TRAP-type C4-dicarboxylate transport system permease small subunit